jgi:chromate transporter
VEGGGADTIPAVDDRRGRLRELFELFLRLGVTAFGGPAAHIAMMEDEVVRRREWLTHEAFLDMIGACNLIPGPNSTEMAIHIGHRRAGFAGLIVAGASFIVPATLITVAVAWTYCAYGALPAVGGALYGVKPVIIAVVVQAIWRLGQSAARTRILAGITAIAIIAGLMGADELLILIGAGAIAIAIQLATTPRARGLAAVVPLAPFTSTFASIAKAGGAAAAMPFSMSAMFLFFVKVGAVLFGSGYVLLAFMQGDLVDRWHWLTQAQLLDAMAVGQFTPGPVFCTATFIGYLLGGGIGATVATIGIFLPAFFFVAISGPILPRIRNNPIAGAFLDGVNAGSLALMAVVTWDLGRTAIVDRTTAVLALVGAILLFRFRLNSAWIVILGGLFGAATMMLWHA